MTEYNRLSIDAHNFGSETKKATGIPLYQAIGQCGSILGTHLFPSIEGPRYIKGFAVSSSLMLAAVIAALLLTASCMTISDRRVLIDYLGFQITDIVSLRQFTMRPQVRQNRGQGCPS